MYIKAFEKMLQVRAEHGMKTTWKTAEEVMEWWLNRKYNPDQEIFSFDISIE